MSATRFALSLGVIALVVACTETQETSSSSNGSGGAVGSGGATTNSGGSTTITTTTVSTGIGGGSLGTTGSGGGCLDLGPQEPNNTESTAFQLEPLTIDDCDESGGKLFGSIVGASDVDWFQYHGTDEFCEVDPTRSLAADGPGLRLCKFIECDSGDTEFSCPTSTTAATSPEGRAGCCAGIDFVIDDLNCTFTLDEDAMVYIRVDQPGGNADTCNGYNLAYHY